jgi:hypothetical protein
MQNHKKHDLNGGRAPYLIEHPDGSTDPRDRRLAAGANDDLGFLMAMLALAEGAGSTLARPVETFERGPGSQCA